MSNNEPTFEDLKSQLAQFDLAAKTASQDAGAARERKGQSAVAVIGAAFTEKLNGDSVRESLLAAGVQKGTVSKIVTVLTGLYSGQIALGDIKSLNGSYHAVKEAILVASGAGTTAVAVSSDAPVKQLTPKEAWKLILDSIEKDKNPLGSASKWLTSITRDITKLTADITKREDEAEEDGE